jgi:hypothetical protein
MVDGVISEQLAEQTSPDWPGDKFRLLRGRSGLNRMHMPGGDYHGWYWWSPLHGGENGAENPVPRRIPRCLLVLDPEPKGERAQPRGRGRVRWD